MLTPGDVWFIENIDYFVSGAEALHGGCTGAAKS
jgi:hypothetical protein